MNFAKIVPVVLPVILFAGPLQGRETRSVAVKELVASGMRWGGAPLPDYPSGQPEIAISRISIPPGASLPLNQHHVINTGVLISVELTVVTKKNQVLQLKSGEPIVEVVNIRHYGKNEGTMPADIIVLISSGLLLPSPI